MDIMEQKATLKSNQASAAIQEFDKLNWSRMNRWNKKDLIAVPLKQKIAQMQRPQHWIVISETWCGDAAHVLPVLHQMAVLNPIIRLEIVMRDENLDFMDNYLFNGTRSIPRLISRDEENQDLFVWGPRPKHANSIMQKSKDGFYDVNDAKILIQKWYNQDKGQQIIRELLQCLIEVDELATLDV